MQAPTKPLADRYRFRQSLDLGAKSLAWIAVDEQSGREVVAAALPGARIAALLGVIGLRHPHIASIVDVVHDPDAAMIPGGARVQSAGIAVAELVRGSSLHQSLKQAPTSPQAAAEWWRGLGEAVRSIHHAGGAHGAISPRSIVVQPSDGRPGPVLTQLLAPSSGAYCAPERLQGRGPSTADDVWALHASLFAAITGSPPFKGDSKDQLVLSMASGRMQALSDFGVNEPDLQALLELGLTADLARRRSDVGELIQALEEWLSRSERTVAIPGPVLHVPDARDWEEDAATVIQEEGQPLPYAALGGRPPAPFVSVPPVPVSDEEQPSDLGDEDDATTIMHHPRAEDIEAAIANARARAAPQPHAPAPVPMPVPAVPDAEPVPGASEPPTEIMHRDALVIPKAPRPAAFDGAPPAPPPPAQSVREQFPSYNTPPAPPPQPSYGQQLGYASQPAAPRIAESGFPPPISAFPPAISRPPQGPDLAQVALSSGDVHVRKAGRGPLLVIFGILLLIAAGIGVAMFLNYRSASAGRSENDPLVPPKSSVATADPVPPSSVEATGPDTNGPSPAGTAAQASTTRGPSLAAAVGAATGSNSGDGCVKALFEPGSFKAREKLDFLCQKDDFRGINSQLHRKLVVAGIGKITPAMREWSELGWYELAATAVIRGRCCTQAEAMEVTLPKSSGSCPQISDALVQISKRPAVAGEIPARTEAFEKAVLCLFDTGTPRPYAYKLRPSADQRATFEALFARALDRRPG